MQAIITKYLHATNTKPARMKASCSRGSIIISCDNYPFDSQNAKDALVKRFAAEDQKEYGTPPASNPWLKKTVAGTLPSGETVFVFLQG